MNGDQKEFESQDKQKEKYLLELFVTRHDKRVTTLA